MNTHSRTHRNVAWSVAISMAEILNQLSGAYPLPFQRDHAQATGLGWLYSLATTALTCRINTMSRPLPNVATLGSSLRHRIYTMNGSDCHTPILFQPSQPRLPEEHPR